MGSPCTIKRNMLSIFLVLDPFSNFHEQNIAALQYFVIRLLRGYAFKIDLLFISGEDYEAYDELGREWTLPEKNENILTARLFSFMYQFTVDYAKSRGRVFSKMKCFNFFSKFQRAMMDHKASQPNEELPLQIWIDILANDVQEHFQDKEVYADFKKKLLTALDEKSETLAERYIDAIKYAVSRGLEPGVTFVNGRVVTDATYMQFNQTAVYEIVTDEQQNVLIGIMDDIITDDK